MGLGFLHRRPPHHRPVHRTMTAPTVGPLPDDQDGMARLYRDCGLLRDLAESAGVRLDDSVQSLGELDQLLPRWREDREFSRWLGNDAGLYLGTVILRTAPGAFWRQAADGRPMLVLPSGFELDVIMIGRGWAEHGTPPLVAACFAATDG